MSYNKLVKKKLNYSFKISWDRRNRQGNKDYQMTKFNKEAVIPSQKKKI